jgi:hypothetical protein
LEAIGISPYFINYRIYPNLFKRTLPSFVKAEAVVKIVEEMKEVYETI